MFQSSLIVIFNYSQRRNIQILHPFLKTNSDLKFLHLEHLFL